MLVIDTRMTPPSSDFVSEEKSRGNKLLHLPALIYRATGISVELEGRDAVFVGSPRAVRLTKNVLQKFRGPIFAAGEKTAVRLLEEGIPVADAGSGNGIEDDFEKFLEKRKCKALAWLSASETAADLEHLSERFGISIRHFPVYETFPAPIDEKFLENLEHPVTWNFYSGKGVLALIRFVQANDNVNLFGKSAKREFENAGPCRESGSWEHIRRFGSLRNDCPLDR